VKRWGRLEVAEKVGELEKVVDKSISQRQLAQKLKIPRTTLQHWLSRKDRIDASPHVVAFLESSDGVAFLHRIVLAAQFVMTLLSPNGIRLVCLFLELSHLDRFVAASYGYQQKVSVSMERAVVEFGQKEEKRLSEGMKPGKVSVCQDETFHPQTCLVAIEPVSDFILLEKYASSRKAEEWSSSMKEAIGNMPIEVVQSTSDEGKGILHHVEQDLGVHHSPDLFHVQSELVKASSVSLAGKKRQAEEGLEKASREVTRHREEKEVYLNGNHGPGRPPSFDKRIQESQEKEGEAQKALETAITHQEQAKKAVQEISVAYHPYNLETGAPRSAEEVSSLLDKNFSQIEDVASKAGLSERCLKRIKKAKRVVVDMIATIAFFFLTVTAKIEALCLSPEVEKAVYNNLIPAIYIRLVSKKAKDVQQRHNLRKKSEELLAPLLARDGPFGGLTTLVA
jgi:transcriptional regulator with XRE-family HTH domain